MAFQLGFPVMVVRNYIVTRETTTMGRCILTIKQPDQKKKIDTFEATTEGEAIDLMWRAGYRFEAIESDHKREPDRWKERW